MVVGFLAAKKYLVLEDRTIFEGNSFGADVDCDGEVVFNTGMVGYPESLTDPSYEGQILCFTYPLIGNYGVPSDERDEFGLLKNFESEKIHARGVIVHECCKRPSHWMSKKTLDEWMKENGVPGIEGIDTRALTKKLRKRGVMLGAIKNEKSVDRFEDPNEKNLVAEVSTKEKLIGNGKRKKIAVIDCGVKNNILQNILKEFDVVLLPWDTPAKRILELDVNGLVISNGPGDPKMCKETIETTKNLLGEIPMLGICLGNQIIALACGGDTYKLKYGHRGQNKPCVDLETKKCYVTSQNHGYAVDANSLPKNVKVWFVNADDKSVEGLVGPNFISVQFHPEASPGPTDTEFVFKRFFEMVKK